MSDNDDIKKQIKEIYGPELQEEFGQVDDSLTDKIASIYTDPESWTEWDSDSSNKNQK